MHCNDESIILPGQIEEVVHNCSMPGVSLTSEAPALQGAVKEKDKLEVRPLHFLVEVVS
jgi:hypothetical protein